MHCFVISGRVGMDKKDALSQKHNEQRASPSQELLLWLEGGRLPAACGEHGWQPFLRVEILFGEFTRGAHVMGIVSVDLCHRRNCLGQVFEGNKSVSSGKMRAKPVSSASTGLPLAK